MYIYILIIENDVTRSDGIPAASGIGTEAALKAGCVPARRSKGASGAGSNARMVSSTQASEHCVAAFSLMMARRVSVAAAASCTSSTSAVS